MAQHEIRLDFYFSPEISPAQCASLFKIQISLVFSSQWDEPTAQVH